MSKLLIFLFAGLLLSTNEVFSQPYLNQTIKHGLGLEYNFDWDKAEKVFQGIITHYPNDPRGYHFQAGIYL